MSVVIETTIGDITVDLHTKERPKTCLNFLKLCKMKYYNFCLFHKVERNFIVQTGDPTATGRGGESIFSYLYGDQAKYFEAELKPRMKHENIGTLSMVNNGNNMNGSQFFLTLGEKLTYLDEDHTVFGEVVEGLETLLKINEIICDQNKRPYQDIRITHTVILHDPYDDPAGLVFPDASPEPTKEMLETDYIAPDEEIDDTKGKKVEEIEESIKESEARARATILEMVGDIPDADVKPPENVLFVCKLNPVTTSEDLELIFSRFGTILSCEVIKDKTSGESLQYAFIEFEKEEDCENAYFKMDNVLIDDRRIHVDFSQSVAKLNWNQKDKVGKGKPGRFQNFVLKSDAKKPDGYEMVFDTDEKYGPLKSRKRDEQKGRSYDKYHHSSRDGYKDRNLDKHSSSSKRVNKYSSKYRHSKSRSPSETTSKTKFRSSRQEFHSYHENVRLTKGSSTSNEMNEKVSRRRRYSSDSSNSPNRKRKSMDYGAEYSKGSHTKEFRHSCEGKSKQNDGNSRSSIYKQNSSKRYLRSTSKSPTLNKRRERSASLSDDGRSKSHSSNKFKSKPQPQKRRERSASLSDDYYSKSRSSTTSKSKLQKRRERSASLSDDNYSKSCSSNNSKSKVSSKSLNKKSKKKQTSSSSDSSSSSSDKSVAKKTSKYFKSGRTSKHSCKRSPSPQYYKSNRRTSSDVSKDKKYELSKSKKYNSSSSDSDSPKSRSKPLKEKLSHHKRSQKSYS